MISLQTLLYRHVSLAHSNTRNQKQYVEDNAYWQAFANTYLEQIAL